MDLLAPDAAPTPWRELGEGLSVPARQDTWTWIAARATSPSPWVAYWRVPPITEDTVIDIVRPSQHSIWVRGLASDLSGPAARLEVRAWTSPQDLQFDHLDGFGLARLASSVPGGVLTVSLGAIVGSDSLPSAARFELVPPERRSDRVVTLVAPEPRHQVRLRLLADTPDPAALQSRLVLRSLDPPGTLFPVRNAIRPGWNHVAVDVPTGRYAVESVPLGGLVTSPAEVRLDVTGSEETIELRVAPGTDRTIVTLSGLRSNDLPVRVRARDDAGIQPPNFGDTWVGPTRWHRVRESIPARSEPTWVEATGRRGAWRSRTALRLSGTATVAELVPARTITLRWIDPPSTQPGDWIVAATEDAQATILVHPHRTLVQVTGDLRPTLTATWVGATTAMQVACSKIDGSAPWTVNVPAGGSELLVQRHGSEPPRLFGGDT